MPNKKTSAPVARKAAKVLATPTASKTAKSIAASALSQAPPKKKAK